MIDRLLWLVLVMATLAPAARGANLSPNLYWDASVNHSRTMTASHDVGHIQGVASGDGARYVSFSGMIDKYDTSWNGITHNDSINDGISNQFGAAQHSGDIDYYNGKIYAPLENDLGGYSQFIAVYDANQPNLPLIAFKDISTQHHEVSALTVVPDQGQHGVIFVTSFVQSLGGDRLWMYDLAGGDPTNAHFGDFLGTLSLPPELQNIQGIVWQAPYFYVSMSGSNSIARIRYENGVLAAHAESVFSSNSTVQGLAIEGNMLLPVEQGGSTTEYVESVLNTAFVPEPGTSCLGLIALAGFASFARQTRSRWNRDAR